MFSFKGFKVLTLTFMPMISVEFIFIYGVKYESNFSVLHVDIQESHMQNTSLSKDEFFSIEFSWYSWWKSIDHTCLNFFLDSQFYSNDLYVCLQTTPHSPNYSSYVTCLEISKSSNSVLFQIYFPCISIWILEWT